jgi:hypothetical protein
MAFEKRELRAGAVALTQALSLQLQSCPIFRGPLVDYRTCAISAIIACLECLSGVLYELAGLQEDEPTRSYGPEPRSTQPTEAVLAQLGDFLSATIIKRTLIEMINIFPRHRSLFELILTALY